MKLYLIILISMVVSSIQKWHPVDFNTDWSITQFVTKCLPLNNTWYKPNDLVDVDKTYTQESEKLRKEVYEAFLKLNKEFYNQFKTNIIILSAYRDIDQQKSAYKEWEKVWWLEYAWKFSSLPGFSEHQLGLAIDIWSISPKYFQKDSKYQKYFEWLQKNAWKYGFINSYQNWVENDWYDNEQRHRRYIWTKLSNHLYKNKLTFTQYYKQHHSISFNCWIKEKNWGFKISEEIIKNNLLERINK